MTRRQKVDTPRAPEGAAGWDARSVELVAEAFGESEAIVGEPAAWRASGDSEASGAYGGASSEGPEVSAASSETSGASGAAAGRGRNPRRGAVDPVKALMHRHRELCERAVDPLEIAAGLEAHGVTDRTAARYRHRDVFGLAEEMYARVPRDDDERHLLVAPPSPGASGTSAGWALLALLPGAVCGLAVAGSELTEGRARLAVGLGGALAVAVALRVALRYGQPRPGPASSRGTHHALPVTRAWVCWLVAYALLGDGLLRAAVSGGPDGPWAASTATALGLSLAVAPAVWCARLFAVRARGRLSASRGLAEFASAARPLLLGVVLLFVCALGVLLAVSASVVPAGGGAGAGAGALGVLLLLAWLLSSYGFTRAPLLMLGAAGAAEAGAVASVFVGRLPGVEWVAVPVERTVDTWGPGVVQLAACGVAAITLLLHCGRTLTRASAHSYGAP
ncbi:hypothetical protein AB0O76_07945 [Streptomyces sp. NPDC086554]|uniref:hypothetical protein n=1 Tax=Streptomyces sp. NPDC086554 TaxID=3154864 RepID=UPI00344ABEDC